MSDLDPHRFGLAPRAFMVHEGEVFLTMAGVLERLHLSESTLRRDAELWGLGRQVSPRRRLWRAAEVDALVESRRPAPKQQPLQDIRQRAKRLAHIIRGR